MALAAVALAARDGVESPPRTWVGVRTTSGGVAVGVASPAGERTLARLAGRRVALDLAVDAGRRSVLVGLCCEPVSGWIGRVRRGAIVGVDQGHRVDLSRAGTVLARADTFGTLAIRPRFPSHAGQLVAAGSGAVDVATGASGRLVAALVDPARVRAFAPTAPVPRRRGVLLLQRRGERWRRVFVASERRYCVLVVLAGDRIGLLRGKPVPRKPLACVGESLDVLDPATRALTHDAVRFPAAVRGLSVDGSGRNLIYVTASGSVGWTTLAGSGGTLDRRHDFIAADW